MQLKIKENFPEFCKTCAHCPINASSIIGDVDRSTLWEGSTMGDPVSNERSSWISPQQEQTSQWILDHPVRNDSFSPATESILQDINDSNNPSAVTARPIFGAFPAASIVAELMDAIQKLNDFIDSITDTPIELRRLREDLDSLQLAVSASIPSFQSQDAQSPLFRALQVCLTSFRQLGLTLGDWQKLDQGAEWQSWLRLVQSFGQKRIVELGVQVECVSALLLVALQPGYLQTLAADTAPPFLDVLGVRNAHNVNVEIMTDHTILEVEEEDE